MGKYTPKEFKPIDNWYKVKLLLTKEKDLIAVVNNPMDLEDLTRKHHVPPDRTGMLLSMPARVCLIRKKDYEVLKAKEVDALANRDHREGRAEGTGATE